jgi:hypothetical protein
MDSAGYWAVKMTSERTSEYRTNCGEPDPEIPPDARLCSQGTIGAGSSHTKLSSESHIKFGTANVFYGCP